MDGRSRLSRHYLTGGSHGRGRRAAEAAARGELRRPHCHGRRLRGLSRWTRACQRPLHADHADGGPFLFAAVVLDLNFLAVLLAHLAGPVGRPALCSAKYLAADANIGWAHVARFDPRRVAVVKRDLALARLDQAHAAGIEEAVHPRCQHTVADFRRSPGRRGSAAPRRHIGVLRPVLALEPIKNAHRTLLNFLLSTSLTHRRLLQPLISTRFHPLRFERQLTEAGLGVIITALRSEMRGILRRNRWLRELLISSAMFSTRRRQWRPCSSRPSCRISRDWSPIPMQMI